jgi:AdoMet-dependent heme synthase
MSKKGIKPRLIAFEVTRQCWYSCLHCRANAGETSEDKLSTSQCKKILKSIAKYSKCILILTGGEPMERGDIYELIRYARKIGLRPVLATCGYLIDEKSIIKLKKAGVTALAFSIDGAGAETHDKFRGAKGAFDSTINAVKIAREAHVRFQINTTISKINADEVIGIAELAKELGAYCFNPFILVPTGRGREIEDAVLDPIEYEVLLNELLLIKLKSEIKVRVTCGPQFARVCRQAETKGLMEDVPGCMGGRGFGFISYRGDVQTCGFLDVPAGNLVDNNFDFKKIWEESEFLKEIRNVSDYKGNCGTCEYAGLCGGCRARAYATSGDYLREDPVCNHRLTQIDKGCDKKIRHGFTRINTD